MIDTCLYCRMAADPQRLPWYVRLLIRRTHKVSSRCPALVPAKWHYVYYRVFRGKIYYEEVY